MHLLRRRALCRRRPCPALRACRYSCACDAVHRPPDDRHAARTRRTRACSCASSRCRARARSSAGSRTRTPRPPRPCPAPTSVGCAGTSGAVVACPPATCRRAAGPRPAAATSARARRCLVGGLGVASLGFAGGASRAPAWPGSRWSRRRARPLRAGWPRARPAPARGCTRPVRRAARSARTRVPDFMSAHALDVGGEIAHVFRRQARGDRVHDGVVRAAAAVALGVVRVARAGGVVRQLLRPCTPTAARAAPGSRQPGCRGPTGPWQAAQAGMLACAIAAAVQLLPGLPVRRIGFEPGRRLLRVVGGEILRCPGRSASRPSAASGPRRRRACAVMPAGAAA